MKKFQEATVELKHRAFQLFGIKELTEIASKTLDDLLNAMLEKAMAVSKARIGSVFMVETEKGRFRVLASRGLESGPQKNTYININDSLARLVVSDKKPLLVQDIETDSRTCRANDPRYGPPSFLSVPIFVRDDLIAVLNLSHKETEQTFDSNDEQILSIIIGGVGFALEKAKLHFKIEEHVKNLQELTEALTSANDQLQQEIAERKRSEEEKEKLEAQLQRVQKMEAIGTLACGTAHNFNNLLTSIMGNTSLMLLETDSDHPNYEKLKIIEKQVQSGSKLTSQLL
ncbi:MAG: GAF domain-containing protein, partial [Candidatus Aminicenantaceae bacterium]